MNNNLLDPELMVNEQELAANWFIELRNSIREYFEQIEQDYAAEKGGKVGKFQVTTWQHKDHGGGEVSIMKGQVFEKVGVNISVIKSQFSELMRKEIPGAAENPEFFATGISLVAHMKNPLIPAVHMNTRYINTTRTWFGGGADLTPTFEFSEDTAEFHQAFKVCCDQFNPEYYPKYKQWCDEYFYLAHRQESRGIGGIFYDYHNTNNYEQDLAFTKAVGIAFREVYNKIVRRNMFKEYSAEQKHKQLIKRGRYVEFNLLYDRGTKFGLMTGGNIDAILMSMPPEVVWE